VLIIILLKEIAKKHITIYNQGTTEGNFTENQGFLLSDNLWSSYSIRLYTPTSNWDCLKYSTIDNFKVV